MERLDVLYLEDDDSWAGLVKTWLGRRKLNVRTLRSREELGSYISRNEAIPRCVLLDLSLNDSSGLALCDEIKRSPVMQQVPIVVLTGTNISARECLEHRALYRLQKNESTEGELVAALESILAQQERSQGLIDAGDLRLDPRGGQVYRGGKLVTRLTPGLFSGFLELVKASPEPLTDLKLYASFLARHPYHHKDDTGLTSRLIVRNYVSHLRRDLGSLIGGRIQRYGDEGYAYRPVKPLPRL